MDAMSTDFSEFLVRFDQATERFMSGEAAPWKELVSRREDTTIMGAWGAWERGWPAVSRRYDWAARRFRDGARLRIERLSVGVGGDLACSVEIEHATVRLAGQEEPSPMTLRVTHIFRREDGAWRLDARHADPILEKTAPEDVLQH